MLMTLLIALALCGLVSCTLGRDDGMWADVHVYCILEYKLLGLYV